MTYTRSSKQNHKESNKMKQNAKKHHTNHSFSGWLIKLEIIIQTPCTTIWQMLIRISIKTQSKHPPEQTTAYAGPADTDGPYTLPCACTILHYETPLAMLHGRRAGRPLARQRQPAWPSTSYNAMLGFYIYHWGKNINPYQPQAPYCRTHHMEEMDAK